MALKILVTCNGLLSITLFNKQQSPPKRGIFLEKPMSHGITICIPDNIEFSDLKLNRDMDGHTSFNWQPIDAICTASGVNPTVFRDMPEDNVAGLIIQWYAIHLQHGGQRDSVADQLLAEAAMEDAPTVGGLQ